MVPHEFLRWQSQLAFDELGNRLEHLVSGDGWLAACVDLDGDVARRLRSLADFH